VLVVGRHPVLQQAVLLAEIHPHQLKMTLTSRQ
jgi:hypothetical protein